MEFYLSFKRLFSGSERSKNIKKNILGSVAIKGISIAVQLALVPLTLGYLSEELYGIWLTLSSVVLWLSFFDIGFSLGLKNRLAEAIALKDFKKGKQLVSTTYGVLILIFIPIGALFEFIIPLINWSRLLNVDTVYNDVLCNVLHILLLSFVLQMVLNTIGAIVAAFQKVALSGAFSVISNLISLIVIWCLARYTNPSLINMSITVSFVPVVVLLVSSLILFRNSLQPICPTPSCFKKEIIKDVFNLGSKFFIIQIQGIVLLQVTNLLISNISGPDYVASYNIAYRYVGASIMLLSLVLAPLWPAFTDAYTQKDYSWMTNIYKKLIRLYLLSLFMIWFMCCISQFVYHLWIGDEAQIPFMMTCTLGIYFSISAWLHTQVILINGIGAVKIQAILALIVTILHIPISLFLGKFMNYGAYGVIISMILMTSIYAIFLTLQLNKILTQKAKGIWQA